MSEKLQFKIRLDGPLHKQITEAAEQNGRSVNAEIVSRLEQSLEDERRKPERQAAMNLLHRHSDVLKRLYKHKDEPELVEELEEELQQVQFELTSHVIDSFRRGENGPVPEFDQ